MRDKRKIYTIIRTGADADRGNFPPAMTEGSFLSLEAAQSHLCELIQKEKDEMRIPFDEADYREEQDDTFWEAYEDGYAAAWFIRFEIVESELMEENVT